MRFLFCLILFFLLILNPDVHAQYQRYVVNVVSLSSRMSDEFSPVFYKDGIVFCSNQSDNSLIRYNNGENRLFKIFYALKKGDNGWSQPKILAKEITTDVNDGPVSFNKNGNIMYYSRNNSIKSSLRNISDTSNKLGIYSAELKNGIWTDIQAFAFNNLSYSVCMPSLTPDGERIYFSSDMPGGRGGMDLYYCDKHDGNWDNPTNLGSVINTPKNETFPFAGMYDKLFFASDGHGGFGGKDLFYTQEVNGEWINPVHLDSAINSPADDFGLVCDSTFNNGFFSTNRRNTDDIFSFSAAPMEFTECDSLKENNYCFTFYDEQHQLIDTIPVTYMWDFGGGINRIGKEVRHCFPGPGEYSVKLTITDDLTGDTIAAKVEYKVNLEKIEQAYINSPNIGIVDKPIAFDGLLYNLKGFEITDYLWNFGDGFKAGGPVMNPVFKKEGEYIIKLGLVAAKDSLGMIPKTCVMKSIRIYNSFQEFVLKNDGTEEIKNEKADLDVTQNNTVMFRIYFADDLSEKQKSRIKEMLKVATNLRLVFDQYGIMPESYPFLDRIAGILIENSDIRLEVVLKSPFGEKPVDKMEMSEKWAQELEFYFRNKEVNMDAFHSKGFGLSSSTFKPDPSGSKATSGLAEFIFMKN